MNVTKRQHYVPRCYLSGFVDPTRRDHKLWVYECGKEPRPCAPESCGYENQLYDFYNGRERRSMEEVLQRLDSNAAPLFRAISGVDHETKAEWAKLIEFIAFQAVRVPSALRGFVEIAQQGADALMLSDGAKEYLNAEMKTGCFPVQCMVDMAHEIRDYLCILNRTVLTSDGDQWPFVTCDAPFGVWTPRDVEPTLPGMMSTDETVICFPLRRDACVLFTRKRLKLKRNTPAQAIRDTNKVLIRSAHRFIYASERNSGIKRIVDRKRGTDRSDGQK